MNIKIELFLTLIIVFCVNINAEKKDSTEINNIIYKYYYGLENGPRPTFDDAHNVCKFYKITVSKTEFEKYMISCAMKIYDSVMSDTNHVDIIQTEIIDNVLWSFDLSTRYNENVEKLLFKLYYSNYSRFIDYSTRMLLKYSDKWFLLAKNIIDSAGTKYNNVDYDLCLELRDKMENANSLPSDSLIYMCYYMLSKRWDFTKEIDEPLAEKEPLYARSYQRLNFAKRVDSALVKIKARGNKKFKKIKSDLDLFKKEAPYEYKTYQMLKKRKDLTNYTPPVLGSRK